MVMNMLRLSNKESRHKVVQNDKAIACEGSIYLPSSL